MAVDSADCINVAAHLARVAEVQPEQRAIVWSVTGGGYAHWSFRTLNEETDRYAHGLTRLGIRRGMRTILMVRPSPPFFALTFALYKIGAVPVLIDPGMGRRRIVECLAKVEAEAFIGIPLAHVLRILHPAAFRSVRIVVTVGRRWGWGGQTLVELRGTGETPMPCFEMAETSPDDSAAIIFTTGSTGPPKGVLYLHGMFDAQVRILREHYGIQPGEIDLPTFPLFALFDPALGMTAVIPDMDPTRPAFVDPTKIIRAIQDQNVTHMFGSPALLRRVGEYGRANGIKLPTLRRVISAGAAVPPDVLESFGLMLDGEAEIHTPYGATEALPVASIGSREILGETGARTARGEGTCVGRPMPGMEARIIRISDEPVERWSDNLLVASNEDHGLAFALPPRSCSTPDRATQSAIGEIVVKGPVVTREYCTDEAATRLAKIPDADGVWHRMGDVGWIDERGRLWFCGRKAHRVVTQHGTLFTEPCEAIFNQHPAVLRSALVGVGERPRQSPVLCVELKSEQRRANRGRLIAELRALGGKHEITRAIETILFHPRFPVDIRHNSKIFREKLALWAATRV